MTFTLVMSYLLLSEQGGVALNNGLKKPYLEYLGKSSDVSVLDLKRGFLKNAYKMSQKYLKNKENFIEFFEKLSSLVKEVF